MFDRHRMRRWRIGHEAQLARFTRDDVYGYYRSRYVPARTIVSIVGAVDPDEALALARATYGDWPAAEGAVDPLAGGAGEEGSPGPHDPRRHHPRRARAGLAHRPAAAPGLERARRRGRDPHVRPRQLALSQPAGARPGDLGVGQQLRADRAWRVQRRRGARGGSAAGGGARESPRPRPDSRCSGHPPRSWSARGLWCAPGGPVGWSPWRAAPAGSRMAEALEDVCSPGPGIRGAVVHHGRAGPGRRGASSAPGCRIGRCLPAGRRGSRSHHRRARRGVRRDRAGAVLPRRPQATGSPDGAPRGREGRRRRTPQPAARRGPAGPAQVGRAPRHARDLRTQARIRSARPGGARRPAGAKRGARRRRARLGRSSLCLRAAGWLAHSEHRERLARLRHLRAHRTPRGGRQSAREPCSARLDSPRRTSQPSAAS